MEVVTTNEATLKLLGENGKTAPLSLGARPISEYTDYNMPILYLSGNAAGMTKDDKVTLNYIFKEHAGTCTLKWQGSSSASLPKKNYTITLGDEVEIVSGWGKQQKYCLKANYVDSSHARNVVCAKLWGQIVKSRTPANAMLNALPNGGAIDGFPIIVSLNGYFHGLYTWNIPKDDWMFGMDGTGQQAIICAERNNNGATAFKGLATFTEDSNGVLDFDVEYSSDDKTDWVLTSLNRLLAAVKDSDGTNITYGITPYLDWESAIDYYIHTVLTANYDGYYRNYLLATYDGVKWFFTGYDMDVVLGLRAMGRYFYSAAQDCTFSGLAGSHKLFGLIWKYMRPQLRARYEELCANVMSVENVANMFVDFVADIPLPVYVDDVRLWNDIQSSSANNLAQIITYYDLRRRNADKWIASTSGETALPTQVNPKIFAVTNTLTNCTTSNTVTTVSKNAAYSATITANEGYELSSVVVTMGGVDITATAYSGGKITIASVTGNVVITATATEVVVSSYTNQVPISIDTDGSIYNGVGWIGRTRLSSSGSLSSTLSDYVSTTGFIPASSGAVIRIGGTDVKFNSGIHYVIAYDSAFTKLTAVNGEGAYSGGTITDEANGVRAVKLLDNSKIAWVRVTAGTTSSDINGPGDKLIVTVNEEIT